MKNEFENKFQKENIELVVFNENEKDIQSFTGELSDEIINKLDNDKLKSELKAKCKKIKLLEEEIKVLSQNFTKLINHEKEKIEELETIINLQTKESKRYQKIIMELKKDINFSREKAIIKEMNPSNSKMKVSNYFLNPDKKEENIQSHDINEVGNSQNNQSLSNSDISFSPKIDQNNISKKWFSDKKNLSIDFDHLEIKFLKLDESKINFMKTKEFKSVEIEICNLTDSTLSFNEINLDSTESKILFLVKNKLK